MQGSKNFYRGKWAEQLACKELIKHGFVIKKRNYRIFKQEVDVVVQDHNGKYFLVEVKYLSSIEFLEINFRSPQMIGYKKRINWLLERKILVGFLLAVVLSNGEVRFFDDILV